MVNQYKLNAVSSNLKFFVILSDDLSCQGCLINVLFTLSRRKRGRAVECNGLENRRGLIPLREFESHRFRQNTNKALFLQGFVFIVILLFHLKSGDIAI